MARAHSKEMIDKGYYRYDFANGEKLWQRLKRFVYKNYRIVGEVFQDRMRSPDHKDNILDNKYREVGIGARTGNYKGTSNLTICIVDFGDR